MATRPDNNNPLMPPSVAGLAGGRRSASRQHRRNRWKGTFMNAFFAAVALTAVAAGGWVGYSIYVETNENDVIEHDRRFAEIQAENEGRTMDDIISDVQDQPRYRRESDGSGTAVIEIIEPVEP